MGRKYNKPFLKDVIARLDFAVPIVEFDNSLPSELSASARTFFPVFEPNEIIAQGLRIDVNTGNTDVVHEQTKLKEWRFFSTNREKILTVTRDSLIINYKIYDSFNVLKKDFTGIIESLFKFKPDVQIRRFGLRYIDIIELNEGQPTNWSKYLNTNLLSIFKVAPYAEVSRAFHSLELNFDKDIKLRFQYGMHNPDYPATIRKKQFVLDYDAYFEGLLQSSTEINDYLDGFHGHIENLFENSIKEKLRVIMDG